MFCFQWLPESAFYLMGRGRRNEARRLLVEAARQNGNFLLPGVLVTEEEKQQRRDQAMVRNSLLWKWLNESIQSSCPCMLCVFSHPIPVVHFAGHSWRRSGCILILVQWLRCSLGMCCLVDLSKNTMTLLPWNLFLFKIIYFYHAKLGCSLIITNAICVNGDAITHTHTRTHTQGFLCTLN